MRGLVLGFDTSCYTTSLAAMDENGFIKADLRLLLEVKPGDIGLRQQTALFQHWNNLPELLTRLQSCLDQPILAVGFSAQPTPEAGSYLPVFTAGTNLASSLALVLKVPSFGFTHQEGHIAAGRFGAQGPGASEFLAVHISGGTSEVLSVTDTQGGFHISVLARTLDLNAGQFVDRIGVALGLPFPAGAALEKMAQSMTTQEISLPAPVIGKNLSFSGPTSAALRLIEQGADRVALARAVFRCIANALEKVLRPIIDESGIRDVLFVGGCCLVTDLFVLVSLSGCNIRR
ncbi:MAG: O-sialoglycoprotein endopeptidase [bacterium]